MVEKTRTVVSIVSHGDANLIENRFSHFLALTNSLSGLLVITLNTHQDFFLAEHLRHTDAMFVINKIPLSFAMNHNNVFKRFLPDHFLVVNPDVTVEDIPKFKRVVDNVNGVLAPTIVEGSVVIDDLRRIPDLKYLFLRLCGARGELKSEANGRNGWVAGCFMVIQGDCFRLLGGFDERYRLYLEDVDFCVRCWENGIPVMVSKELVVHHVARRRSWRHLRYFFWHLSSYFNFFVSCVLRELKRG